MPPPEGECLQVPKPKEEPNAHDQPDHAADDRPEHHAEERRLEMAAQYLIDDARSGIVTLEITPGYEEAEQARELVEPAACVLLC
jgi:hypothetical protein